MSTHTVKDLSDRTVCTVEIGPDGRVWRNVSAGVQDRIGRIERHGAGAWTARDMMGHTMAGDTRKELLHWLTTRPLIVPVKAPAPVERHWSVGDRITEPEEFFTLPVGTICVDFDDASYRVGRKFMTDRRTVVRQDRLGQSTITYDVDTVPAGSLAESGMCVVYLPA